MKKLGVLSLLVVFLSISSILFAATDNFLGIKYGTTFDQYSNLVRGFELDGSESTEDFKKAPSMPIFHKGVEKLGDTQIGSVFYCFNEETKMLKSAYCNIEFDKSLSLPKVERRNQGIFPDDYFIAIYPFNSVKECYNSIVNYMNKTYGDPLNSWDYTQMQDQIPGQGAVWHAGEGVTITVNWSELIPNTLRRVGILLQTQQVIDPITSIF